MSLGSNPSKSQIVAAYGLKVFGSRDKEVRTLKRIHKPSLYGFRIWTSSWILMDFLRLKRMKEGKRIMELGCGWGLAGIYCAKRHRALVTSVDMDAQVFPFLKLHAEANGVSIHTMVRRFVDLEVNELSGIEMIIGADICFWQDLVEPLIRLIERGFSSGVHLVLIADPGRGTFTELAQHFIDRSQGEIIPWSVESPYKITGQILAISP